MAPVLLATARDAAEALVAALNLRYGEITIHVTDGQITVFRQGTSLRLDDLALVKLYDDSR